MTDRRSYAEDHESVESLREEGPDYCIMRRRNCEHARTHTLQEEWGTDYETVCSFGDDEGDEACAYNECDECSGTGYSYDYTAEDDGICQTCKGSGFDPKRKN